MELCRNVIDLLDTESVETSVADQEAQLRVIAKAVDQLEKSGVPVPDPLNTAKRERFQMTQDGLLRRGSPRGIWELAENSQ